MWFSHILDRHCQQRGDAPAVVEGSKELTWRQLSSAVHSLAAHLHDRGIRHGDRVAVYSRNRAEMIVSYFALAHLGAPFVPVNHAMQPAEYQDVAERFAVKHVLGEQRLLARLGLAEDAQTDFDSPRFQAVLTAETPPPPLAGRMEDPFAVLLTSGTTGRPKGVVQTAQALRQMSLSWLAATGADDRVRLLNLNSLAHGSITFTSHYLAAGATIHLQREFQPRAVLRAIQQKGITHVWLVPQMLRFLLTAAGPDATVDSGLREIMFGASPITPELLEQTRRTFGCDIRNVYGMTEAGGTFATWLSPAHDNGPRVPLASSGRSVPGLHVEIQDDAGIPLPTGTVGEVCVRSAGRMSSYLDNQAATDETVVNGWVRTGDLGLMDENGFVHLKDRKKDLIKRGGQNVYPAEVEAAIREYPGVHDVAVIGVPDPDWTEAPAAFVVPEEGARLSALDLLVFLRGRLATYKQPRELVFVDEIPRNGAGKVLRRVLAENAQDINHAEKEVASR
ncbi:class I adenylate-forming enzyme family protein [Streptomyces roseochromogenus]|uniref:Long-chain fatty acid--CoA ligase n=1 Tax=Streptomyces roseochromogenus subsp. oscitans DS 12.976 TaxID=1352936 RepID=V6KQD7_STRRC|nr:AMP-binding protein [Streptomyces roseochromogenus]EST34312.1 hypothetical protein M878_11200 [Streptomyces roseochromogenus subsp. oscitans DS 12.976]